MTAKSNYCIVWHGHHNCDSPLEFLNESYTARLETIKTEKAKDETPEQIKIRLKLFKRVRGKLPKALQKACADWQKAYADGQKEIMNNFPAILKLHAKECGCGWTPEKPNIFEYMT